MELRVVQTTPKLVLEWDPVPGAVAGYRGKAGGASKWTQTQQTRMTFAANATGIVIQALGVEDEGKYPTPEPEPQPGFAMPTYEAKLTRDADGSVYNQAWALCTSPTTINGSWGGTPCRDLVSPQGSSRGSWEWWCLFQIYIPSAWNVSTEGNVRTTTHDWHNAPGDVGWGDSASGVSAMHFKFRRNQFALQHEYSNPSSPDFLVKDAPQRDFWHSIAIHTIWGRTDGSIPSAGHPNGGKGRTRVYLNGPQVLDTGDINILQRRSDGVIQKRMQVLEGGYYAHTTAGHNFQFTLSRFGRTLAEALADSQIQPSGVFTEANGQPVIARIADRSTSSFVAPQV